MLYQGWKRKGAWGGGRPHKDEVLMNDGRAYVFVGNISLALGLLSFSFLFLSLHQNERARGGQMGQ